MPSQTKKITLDAGALFFGKVVGLLLGMLRLNYLATYLGVANFGILNFALYFCSLFQVLFDFGISQFLTRDLARDLSRSKEFVGKAILLKVIIVFIAGLLVGLVGVFSHFDATTNWAILLTTVVFAINGLSMVFLSAFQAHRKMIIVSISNILNDLILSVFIILVISQYPFVITVLLLSIVVALLNLVILFIVYVRKVGLPSFQIDTSLWREFLKESLPIAVSSLGISLYTFIGATILKYTRGDIEVGIYSAGYKLISILTLIPITFSQIVYPIFSEFYANAQHKLVKALQDSLRVMAEISFPLAVGIVFLAPKVISLLYPDSFEGASTVLRLIICGEAFVYLAWIVYMFLLALGHQKMCMVISISIAIISFIVNVYTVPHFGYFGVALTIMITDVLLLIVYVFYLLKIGLTMGNITSYLKILLASTIMGVFLFIVKDWYLVPAILAGIGLYFIAMLILRGFGDQEKEFLAKIFSR